jgi:hypothetical protein
MDEARTEFERAAGLTRNSRERDLLIERASACADGPALSEPQLRKRSQVLGLSERQLACISLTFRADDGEGGSYGHGAAHLKGLTSSEVKA